MCWIVGYTNNNNNSKEQWSIGVLIQWCTASTATRTHNSSREFKRRKNSFFFFFCGLVFIFFLSDSLLRTTFVSWIFFHTIRMRISIERILRFPFYKTQHVCVSCRIHIRWIKFPFYALICHLSVNRLNHISQSNNVIIMNSCTGGNLPKNQLRFVVLSKRIVWVSVWARFASSFLAASLSNIVKWETMKTKGACTRHTNEY